MTEAFEKWRESVKKSRYTGDEDFDIFLLRAFVKEVEREIGKARFRTSINVASAYEKFVREFGLDGEKRAS